MESHSDDTYLGQYVAPPALSAERLGHLDPGNIGAQCTQDFRATDLLLRGFLACSMTTFKRYTRMWQWIQCGRRSR